MNSKPFHSRTFRIRLIVLTVLLIGTVSVIALYKSTPSRPVSQFDVTSLISARHIVDYEQPTPELVEAISAVYSPSDKDVNLIPESSKGLDIAMIDNVPFYHYWQDDVERYVFHPMAYGGFLARLNCDEPIEKYVDEAIAMAHDLPNGGLLWYYPDNYQLNRFIGPDLSPSAISQGQILGSITNLNNRCQIDFSALARRIFLGLSYDYYDGGVNFQNSALLEIPLFRSAPEIILNGWLHALLHLNNYVVYYQDVQAKELLSANINFLATCLKNFHDEQTGLSLYSDLCPYSVRLHHETEKPQNLTVFYKSTIGDFNDLVFELKAIEHDTQSPYDNQIIRQTKSFTDIWISCSQHYETYIVSDKPVNASFSTGKYSPGRSTPGKGGTDLKLRPDSIEQYYVINVTSVRDMLFCGYPTNFSKLGENYYHAYHVVALACILASIDLPDETRASLTKWMERWVDTIESFGKSEKFKFTSYDKILRDLFKHKVFTLTDDWDKLLRTARKSG